VSRSKRLRGRYRDPANPLWSDGTACHGAHYRSFRSLPVPPDSEGSQNSTADIGTCLPNPRCLPGRAGGSPNGLAEHVTRNTGDRVLWE
jgi:hypothetical protein